MDMKKISKIPQCGELGGLDKSRIVVGAKQLKKAVAAGRARCVFLAENADPALTEPIAALCQSYHVNCVWVSTMSDLGQACGIDVGAAAAATIL